MNEIMNTVGRVAEGKNFFGRIKEIQHAIELLEDGANLILAAPRRVGKTSFARKLKEEMENKGWKGVNIDLQLAPTEIDFMKLILREIKGINILDWLQSKTPEIKEINIKEVGVEFNKRKPIFYQEIQKVLPHDKETLIILDEFVIFLNDVLMYDKEKYTFRSPLLRDFWYNKFGG
ncbi:MAG: AAA-like domain-containing protein [Candidatus Cloacimonetes bacterium]|nr:AAA-like domain-containing protein [Candidatus Cloacimonadota bacterium]